MAEVTRRRIFDPRKDAGAILNAFEPMLKSVSRQFWIATPERRRR
jgi:hypothetical protein